MTRPNWDKYFMLIMDSVSSRSTCDRGRTACVIVKDNQIISTGYAGAPPGFPHCDESSHIIERRVRVATEGNLAEPPHDHCIRTIHAEMNAILQAAKKGIAIEGATVYIRMTPCRTCAMALISVGVSRVVCEKRYHDGEESEEMLKTANISLTFFSDDVQQYPKG